MSYTYLTEDENIFADIIITCSRRDKIITFVNYIFAHLTTSDTHRVRGNIFTNARARRKVFIKLSRVP